MSDPREDLKGSMVAAMLGSSELHVNAPHRCEREAEVAALRAFVAAFDAWYSAQAGKTWGAGALRTPMLAARRALNLEEEKP